MLKRNQKKKHLCFFLLAGFHNLGAFGKHEEKRVDLNHLLWSRTRGQAQHFAGDFYRISKNGSPVGKGKRRDPKAVLTVFLLVLEKKVDGS